MNSDNVEEKRRKMNIFDLHLSCKLYLTYKNVLLIVSVQDNYKSVKWRLNSWKETSVAVKQKERDRCESKTRERVRTLMQYLCGLGSLCLSLSCLIIL